MTRPTPAEFAAKWKGSTAKERAAAQEHFIDLCRMLGVATPNEADPDGTWYAFEAGTKKTSGGDGFADVWKRGYFAWEYKGKRRDLAAAYKQLLDYREALENPPLLVVCDLNRFEVHTNFTGTAKHVYTFDLDDLLRDPAEPLRVLRAVMSSPDSLRPTVTRQHLTEEAAEGFAVLARRLRDRGHDAHRVAHFLNKLLFCMFAEDAGLLPGGLLDRLIEGTRRRPEDFTSGLRSLFEKMCDGGGYFGADAIEWFNGGLFDAADVLPLDAEDIRTVQLASRLDWSQIEPAIFGTLFERGLDPDKRSQLGAHYTDRASIERIVVPVVLDPLRKEFEAMKVKVEQLLASGARYNKRTPIERHPLKLYESFMDRLRSVRVLDPACGSGNFLYVALWALKNLEREATIWASSTFDEPLEFPVIGPEALLGIELNAYAAELARVTIWIGEIQWMISNGYAWRRDPVLRTLDNIECRDAILDLSDPLSPAEAVWPEADFVVGNPPFLGNRLLRRGLGVAYVDAMFQVFGDRIPGSTDLVGYWFEKARSQIERGRAGRVGLLATQGIRGQANRTVLQRIKQTGDIFLAWADEPWVLDGAAVRVSIVGFDGGGEQTKTLDGVVVQGINADLTSGHDLTLARPLPENEGIAFYADVKAGPFDLSNDEAQQLIASPNPDGRHNRDVVRPWCNGLDVTRRPRGRWIVDFGVDMTRHEAALYEAPFEYVRTHVKPVRDQTRRPRYRDLWWLHAEPGPGMRQALRGLPRYIATPATSKHRVFVWLPGDTLADHALVVFARDDYQTLGLLQSRVHVVWSLAVGTQLESRPRYTPTTCFETFPFPAATASQATQIAQAAEALDGLRSGWLNPLGLSEAALAKRTLTNLYNSPPSWLRDAHDGLDAAVLDAYGWPVDISDDAMLGSLLELNLVRANPA